MTGSNDDRWDRDRQHAPPPRDELDELLHEWHRQSAQHATAVRDRLLGELQPIQELKEPRASARANSRIERIWNYFATHRLPRIAASLIIVLGIAIILLTPGWPFGGRGSALAKDFTQFGFDPAMPTINLLVDPNDQAAFRQAENVVEQARRDLAEAMRISDRNVLDPWIPWTKLYRNLAVVGQWDEAIHEAREFLAYAKGQNELPGGYSMYYTALSDLGNIHVALGDFENAVTLYEQSLAAAQAYQVQLHVTGLPADARPHVLDLKLAVTLSSRLWMLSTLHAAEGDTQQAWNYVNQAEKYLITFFAKECAARRLNVAPDASLAELCLAVVADGDEGLRAPVVKVRESMLYRTRLLRIDGDVTSAAQTLELAGTLPPHPFSDESRLDFNEPMERLRLAIARGDFAAALDAADEAGRHLGARYFDEELLSHPPIGLLARAEFQFFRGLARAGLDPKDPEALILIDSAINAVTQSATSLPQEQRERFSNRFAEWKHVLHELRK